MFLRHLGVFDFPGRYGSIISDPNVLEHTNTVNLLLLHYLKKSPVSSLLNISDRL